MENDIKYGVRHREVALFLAIVFGIFTAISSVFLLWVFEDLSRAMPFATDVAIWIGVALAFLVACVARVVYLLWKHPPVEISGGLLRVVDGMRHKEFRLDRISGPIKEYDWLGFSGLTFFYDRRKKTCITRLLPPADRDSLRRRLEAQVTANKTLHPTGCAGG